MYKKYVRNPSKCVNCNFCTSIVKCPSPNYCIACMSCYLGCPHLAIDCIQDTNPRKIIKITIDGIEHEVPERITVKDALEMAGYAISQFPQDNAIFVPCHTGGCFSCSVLIDGQLMPSCHTPVKNGMKISTQIDKVTPLRRVEGFSPHTVGGVGTPYQLKSRRGYIEAACFVAGCNLRCPTCQNFFVTYDSSSEPITPKEAAARLTLVRKTYHVDRMAISGGEPTINRRWLVQFFKELRAMNKDEKARFHLDTNATVLTKDYIDELILGAGITDIGPDLKGLRVETFQNITGIKDRSLAEKYLKTAWDAVRYIADNYYPDKVFMGIGIPYNKAFYPTMEELYRLGYKLSSIDPEIQVCVLDYRPTFRRLDIVQPTPEEMLFVKKVLEETGLKTVIVQTTIGHIGP